MRFRDGAADAKSHASSMKLRGKERVEDPVRLLPGQPDAGIADRHRNVLVLCSLRPDGELARSVTSFIASMPLITRFISTCCNCTRSP